MAEIFGISDKTISKWERGNGFPEVSLLLPLCNELEITVNELLSGERLEEVDYKKKAEENMVNLVREAQESKKKIILSFVVVFFAVLAAMPLFAIVEYVTLNKAAEIALIVIGIIILVGGVLIACVDEVRIVLKGDINLENAIKGLMNKFNSLDPLVYLGIIF